MRSVGLPGGMRRQMAVLLEAEHIGPLQIEVQVHQDVHSLVQIGGVLQHQLSQQVKGRLHTSVHPMKAPRHAQTWIIRKAQWMFRGSAYGNTCDIYLQADPEGDEGHAEQTIFACMVQGSKAKQYWKAQKCKQPDLSMDDLTRT